MYLTADDIATALVNAKIAVDYPMAYQFADVANELEGVFLIRLRQKLYPLNDEIEQRIHRSRKQIEGAR